MRIKSRRKSLLQQAADNKSKERREIIKAHGAAIAKSVSAMRQRVALCCANN